MYILYPTNICFIQKMSSNGSLDYSPEVLCLMYVNGDRDDPNRKTAKFIEEIIRNKLQCICCIMSSSFEGIPIVLLSYEFSYLLTCKKNRAFEIDKTSACRERATNNNARYFICTALTNQTAYSNMSQLKDFRWQGSYARSSSCRG